MNTFTTFRDGTSMSTDEWNEVLAREELFIAGMASLFGLKELTRPLSEDARKYETIMGWKRKEVSPSSRAEDIQ